jgi:DNA polymerase-1
VVEGLDAANPMDRSSAERIAINTPIQGSAADLIKLAMLAVDKAIVGTSAKLLLQVHDELVLEVPEGEVEEVRVRVRAAMEGVRTFDGVALRVPLLAETGVSRTWGGAH